MARPWRVESFLASCRTASFVQARVTMKPAPLVRPLLPPVARRNSRSRRETGFPRANAPPLDRAAARHGGPGSVEDLQPVERERRRVPGRGAAVVVVLVLERDVLVGVQAD